MDLREEIYHTLARLRAHVFLTAQVAQLDALLPGWDELQQHELALKREELEVEARVLTIDEALDFLSVAISAALQAETGGDHKAPIYLRYFGTVPPSKLRRPVLGAQPEVIRTWVPSLTGEQSSAALRGYGAQLEACVSEADAAVRASSEARRKRADFDLGPRKAFVDRRNALRLSLYGQLAELVHGRPELGLASDFATAFFMRDTRNRQLSLSELEQTILCQRERLHKLEAELARRVEEAELAARYRAIEALAAAEAELAAADAELAAAAQQRAELAARVAELQAERKNK